MTILYEVYDNLYVNITNRCPCACTFCLRETKEEMNHSGSLWLSHEPSIEEIIGEFSKFNKKKYHEIVFCGFGEPTERLADLLVIAAWVKDNLGLPVRVNTNGLSDLIHGKDTAPMFAGVVDVISISLNTPDKVAYDLLTRNKFGEEAFDGLVTFASNVKKYVPKVILTTVDTTITKKEEDACRKLCDSIGVTYRIREWED